MCVLSKSFEASFSHINSNRNMKIRVCVLITVCFASHAIFANPLFDASFPKHSYLLPRQATQTACSLSVRTDGWTTCANRLSSYNITLADFTAINPTVGVTCQYFSPGKSYCLMKRMFNTVIFPNFNFVLTFCSSNICNLNRR